jgi:hypothetical protein
MNTYDNELAATALYNNLGTPTLGIGLDRMDLFELIELSASLDYFFAALGTDFLDSGLDLNLYVAYPFLDFGGLKGAAFFQTYAMILTAQDASESNINITIGMRFNFNEN